MRRKLFLLEFCANWKMVPRGDRSRTSCAPRSVCFHVQNRHADFQSERLTNNHLKYIIIFILYKYKAHF